MFRRNHNTTTTRSTKPTFMTRLKGPTANNKTYKTEETVHQNGHQHGTGTSAGAGTTTTRTAPRRTWGRRNHHTTPRTAPVHHHRRRPSIGDKMSGAMLKLKGSLTRRPGVKAAGTRRMHGTDGLGSHRY